MPHMNLTNMLLMQSQWRVVQEMHQHTPSRTATQHRKTAVSFRDLSLLDIFGTSLEALRYLKGSSDLTVQKQVRCWSGVQFFGIKIQ